MRASVVLAVAVLVVTGIGVGLLVASGNGSAGPVGEVCGITELVGGPGSSVILQESLVHTCPSERLSLAAFRVMSSSGTTYVAYMDYDDVWTAWLPAGTYRVIDRPGCPGAGPPFVVVARETVRGVIIQLGCSYR